MMKRRCILWVIFLLFHSSLSPRVVDRIVAIVGTEVITESELVERLFLNLPQKETHSDSYQAEVLNGMIEEKLLLVQAKAETIEVDPKEVETALNNSIEEIKSRFPSEEALETELAKEKLNLEGLKERYRKKIRDQLLVQKWVQEKIQRKITVSDLEVQLFYEKHPDSIPPLPEQATLSHILIVILPSEKTEKKVQDRLLRISESLGKGEPFASLARRYSEDPANAKNGGDLGFFRKGEMVKEFDEAVSQLKPGVISPFRSRFGYHLVEVLERKGDEVHARHILLQVLPSKEDTLIARKRIAAVREKVLVGQDFGELARQHSDDLETRNDGGILGVFSLQDINPFFKEAVVDLKVGEVTPVIKSPYGFHLIKLVDRQEAKTLTFEEIKENLRNYLVNKRIEKAYQKWVEDLKKEIYVETRLN